MPSLMSKYRKKAARRQYRTMTSAEYIRIYGKKAYNKLPSRFRGTSKKKYAFAKKVSKAVAQVAENKFKTNRYDTITPKPFVHAATDGYQCSWNLGDATSDYSGQGLPVGTGLQCLNVLPADRDGDYIFGKSLVSRIGIYMHPLTETDAVPDDLWMRPKTIQFNLKVLKINSKYTPNGQQGSNVLSTQCWIDEKNETCGFSDARNFTQLDLKYYQVNKRRFNVLRNHNFMLTVPSMSTSQEQQEGAATATNVIPQKAFPSKKYFSIRIPINKKLYYDPAFPISRPPTNLNESIYVLITATGPNDTVDGQLANKWSVDTTNTFIYTDM